MTPKSAKGYIGVRIFNYFLVLGLLFAENGVVTVE